MGENWDKETEAALRVLWQSLQESYSSLTFEYIEETARDILAGEEPKNEIGMLVKDRLKEADYIQEEVL